MKTVVYKMDPEHPDQQAVKAAAEVIRRGGLVAFPTETVYGLGANALDGTAVNSIFAAKGRPHDNPLIVHVARIEQVKPLVTEVSPTAELLMKRFWPGPLTLLFPKSDLVPPEVSAGLDTVAIRMPRHKVALSLILESGLPIAAPSANSSGRPSPTLARHVLEDLEGRIDVVLDGGPTGIGVESTVLDITSTPAVVLRPGGVTLEQLQEVLGENSVKLHEAVLHPSRSPKKVTSPGMKYKHYAPRAEVLLVSGNLPDVVRRVTQLAYEMAAAGKKVGILACAETAHLYPPEFKVLQTGSRDALEEVAASLFSRLREFDELGMDVIVAEAYPEKEMGVAVMNRLIRAAAGRLIRA
ncbi:MAG TPA: threonylcarbamoyl-AMP synthase [Firmicutes bacterium]|nr:threonylcarbamoyl-AMP synthase [Bacillota bacterium]